jgi:hypothetical protein
MAPLPEGTVVTLTLYPLEEQVVSEELALMPGRTPRHFIARMEKQGFCFERKREQLEAGEYRAVVEVSEDRQCEQVRQALKGVVIRKWERDFALWGEALVARLGPGLREVDELARELIELIERFSVATGSVEAWEGAFEGLERDQRRVDRRIGEAGSRRFYPAAFGVLQLASTTLRAVAVHIGFGPGGKMEFKTQGSAGRARGLLEDFGFERLAKQVERARGVAGREFCLWIVKALRRGVARDALMGAVRNHAEHEGVSAFSDRLERTDDLDGLEKSIRGGTEEKKP